MATVDAGLLSQGVQPLAIPDFNDYMMKNKAMNNSRVALDQDQQRIGLLAQQTGLDTQRVAMEQAQLPGKLAEQQQLMKYQQSQIEQQQFEQNMKKFSTVNSLMGAVAQNPTQQNYNAVLSQAQQLGLDTRSFPADVQQAMPLVQNAYIQSGQAMENLKARAEISTQQVLMGSRAAQANAAAQNAGLPLPFPGQADQQGGALGSGQPGPQGQATAGTVQGQPAPQTTSNQPLVFPAEKAKQEQQAKDWSDSLSKSGDAANQYSYANAILNQASQAVKEGIPTGPIAGYAKQVTPSGQLLTKNVSIIQQNLVKQLAQAGVGRIMQGELGMISKGTPDNFKYPSVNQAIIDNLKANNEIANNLAPKVIQDLDKLGVRSKSVSGNIIADTVKEAQIFDPKTGEVMPGYEDRLKSAYQKVMEGKGLAVPQPKFQAPDGKTYSADDINTVAKANNMDPQQVMQQFGIKPVSINDHHPATEKLMDAISHVESGGQKEPYTAMNNAGKGRQALGRYQVLASNVPAWTKEALGVKLTPEEFVNSPGAQDAVARFKLDQLAKKYNNVDDIASVWYSGKPLKNNKNYDYKSKQSVKQYVDKVKGILTLMDQSVDRTQTTEPGQQIPNAQAPQPQSQMA